MSKEKCCGNCKHFDCEASIDWCPITVDYRSSDDVCDYHHPRNNGWTEITPDNVDEVTDLAVVTDGKDYRMAIQWHLGVGTMAKVGGYYFYVLPGLKIE